METDEDEYSDRNVDYNIKRQKGIEQELGIKTLIFLMLSMKYLGTSNNRLFN